MPIDGSNARGDVQRCQDASPRELLEASLGLLGWFSSKVLVYPVATVSSETLPSQFKDVRDDLHRQRVE